MITMAIKAIIIAAIIASISDILYAVECALCKFIGFLDKLFDMLAGVTPILYKAQNSKLQYDPSTGGAKVVKDGVTVAKETSLIEVVFNNSSVNKIFWNMALIGIAMVFGFAIFAVIRKMFDTRDKMKHSMGDIIGNSLKSIVLICAMNLIVTVALSGSQILLNTMNSVFRDSAGQDVVLTITYDENDYAAMLRCMNTLGNYSLNPSRNSRYNLNACFNDMQEDLEYLKGKGIFRYPYRFELTTTDPETGENIVKLSGVDSWQSVLYDIAMFGSGSEVYIDDYNEGRNDAILCAMDILNNNKDFKPLEKYTVTMAGTKTKEFKVDRMVMLLGTMDAAWNSSYNNTMSFTDSLRGPFLYGQKDIYNHSQMNSAFDYWLFTWHHVLVIFFAILFIKQYLGICFNAVARVFNMIFLYLISPAFIAVTPLDDGGKAKQWSTAFIIQTFSLFGTVLALRLFKLIISVVISENVIFFSDSEDQMCAQAVFILACAYVVRRAGGMLTGILADNAGMQAINASDLMSEAGGVFDRVKGGITSAGRKAAGFAYGTATKGTGALDKKRENSKQAKASQTSKKNDDAKWDTRFNNLAQQLGGRANNMTGEWNSGTRTNSIPNNQSSKLGSSGQNNGTQINTTDNQNQPQKNLNNSTQSNNLGHNQIPSNKGNSLGNNQGSNTSNNSGSSSSTIPKNQSSVNNSGPSSNNVSNNQNKQNLNNGSNVNQQNQSIPNPLKNNATNDQSNVSNNQNKQNSNNGSDVNQQNQTIPQQSFEQTQNSNFAQGYSNPQNYNADSGYQNNFTPQDEETNNFDLDDHK